MPKIVVNGLRFHYWQSGQGPDVVLVHGLGGNLAGWHLTMVPALQADYRVTTNDLRGHGRSDAPTHGYTTRDMAEDLCGILDKLGVGSAHIVGHSWGADIALHFALLHPERVLDLVLVEGALLAPLAPAYRRQDWAGWPYVMGTIEELSGRPIPEDKRYDLNYLLRELIEIPIMYGPAKGRLRDEDVLARVAEVLRPIWRGEDCPGALSAEAIAQIRHPTLLVYEANSVFREAYELLRTALSDHTSKLLPAGDVRHFTSLEHPEQVLELMRAFFEREALLPARVGARA